MHHHHHHHHDPHRDHAWRRFEAMARRGFGGMGQGPGGRGDWGGFGGNFRIGRMLASGDLRLVLLYLIEQQPRHGYDLIKAVEEQSKGLYSPSPGIVYPALTFLEEAGYASSEPEGNKKLYTITEEGRAHLADNRDAIQSTLNFLGKAGEKMQAWREMERNEAGSADGDGFRRRGWGRGHQPPEPPVPPVPPQPPFRGDRDMPDVVPELNAARRALKSAMAETVAQGAAAQRRIADILAKAVEDIRAIAPDAGEDEIDI